MNFPPRDGAPTGIVRTILEDDEGSIWVGTADGLWRFRDSRWSGISVEGREPIGAVLSLYQDRFKRIWLGATIGTFRRGSGQAGFQRLHSDGPVEAFSEDRDGTIIVAGAAAAVRVLDPSEPSQYPSTSGVSGLRLISDRQGNTWAATSGDGLLRLAPHGTGSTRGGEYITERMD